MKDIAYLHKMYNATSTEHPVGSDEIETYEHWLERQLLSRLERVDQLESHIKESNTCIKTKLTEILEISKDQDIGMGETEYTINGQRLAALIKGFALGL